MSDSPYDFQEPRECPKCGSYDLTPSKEVEGWAITCNDCGHAWGRFKAKPAMYKKI